VIIRNGHVNCPNLIYKSYTNKGSLPGQASRSVRPDRVHISQQAKHIGRARAVIEEVPVMRAQKIAEVKRAIEKGIYDVSSGDIAECLLSFWREGNLFEPNRW